MEQFTKSEATTALACARERSNPAPELHTGSSSGRKGDEGGFVTYDVFVAK
jgi:hypothetical protein